MKKLIYIILPFLFFACSESAEKVEETIEFKTAKERLSYVLGAMNAKTIIGTQDPNIKRLDMEEIALGFNENLSVNRPEGCDVTLTKLFGPNMQDFDTVYAKSGAHCMGRLTGYSFFKDIQKMGGLNQIDLNMVKIGFRHGLLKKDTIIAEKDKQTIIQDFLKKLNELNGKKMMDAAKKISGAQVFDNGIVLQVISDGKGGSPTPTDDVIVEYILTSALGDTIQSSYDMKKKSGSTEPVALSLNGGVIPGWTYVVPKMKKGGKYRVFIPWQEAYGEQMGRESLCFLIELVDYGKGGSLVKPKVNTGM
jgi:FKBP-type peptidyl-prolyl cis-trans isomerase FkpA